MAGRHFCCLFLLTVCGRYFAKLADEPIYRRQNVKNWGIVIGLMTIQKGDLKVGDFAATRMTVKDNFGLVLEARQLIK